MGSKIVKGAERGRQECEEAKVRGKSVKEADSEGQKGEGGKQ